jgi:hypothetical protein
MKGVAVATAKYATVLDQAASSVSLHFVRPLLMQRILSSAGCVAALLRPKRSRRLAFYGTLLQCLSVRLARPVPVLLGLGFDGTARQAARRQLGWGAPWSRPGRAPTTGQLQLFGDDGIKSRAAPPQSLIEKARQRGIGTLGEKELVLREKQDYKRWRERVGWGATRTRVLCCAGFDFFSTASFHAYVQVLCACPGKMEQREYG